MIKTDRYQQDGRAKGPHKDNGFIQLIYDPISPQQSKNL